MATAAGVIKQGPSGPIPGKGIWGANVCRPGTLDCVGTDSNGFFYIPVNYVPGETLTASAGGWHSKNFVPTWDPAIGAYYAIVELSKRVNGTNSCFTGDTLVRMADATSKRIDRIAIGDQVLDHEGRLNTVVDIETPVLGNRQLYSINNGPYFVTNEHPFMTDSGWVSIEPKSTFEENPNLKVGRLTPGQQMVKFDRVRQLAMAQEDMSAIQEVEVSIKPEILDTIQAKRSNWNTRLYNLILDGSHTYFANDYLAHNKGGH